MCHIAMCKQHAKPKSLPVFTKHQMELLEKTSAFYLNVDNAVRYFQVVCISSNSYAFLCVSLGLCFVLISGPSNGH